MTFPSCYLKFFPQGNIDNDVADWAMQKYFLLYLHIRKPVRKRDETTRMKEQSAWRLR